MIGIGDFVTTQNSDIHKRVIDINKNVYSLEWYSYAGREVEFISSTQQNPKITHVSNRETKQFSEQKRLYKKGKESFHAEQERKRKQRIEVAKNRDFRKTVSSLK